MAESCRACNGSGCRVTFYLSKETGKRRPRITACKRCDGVGKHHVCSFKWCREKA